MTNKIEEIKNLICTEQIKLLGHNILTPYLANAVELLDQLDLRTEKDLLNDLYAKLGEWFSMANILLPNNHPYYHYVNDLLKQISEIKP